MAGWFAGFPPPPAALALRCRRPAAPRGTGAPGTPPALRLLAWRCHSPSARARVRLPRSAAAVRPPPCPEPRLLSLPRPLPSLCRGLRSSKYCSGFFIPWPHRNSTLTLPLYLLCVPTACCSSEYKSFFLQMHLQIDKSSLWALPACRTYPGYGSSSCFARSA